MKDKPVEGVSSDKKRFISPLIRARRERAQQRAIESGGNSQPTQADGSGPSTQGAQNQHSWMPNDPHIEMSSHIDEREFPHEDPMPPELAAMILTSSSSSSEGSALLMGPPSVSVGATNTGNPLYEDVDESDVRIDSPRASVCINNNRSRVDASNTRNPLYEDVDESDVRLDSPRASMNFAGHGNLLYGDADESDVRIDSPRASMNFAGHGNLLYRDTDESDVMIGSPRANE